MKQVSFFILLVGVFQAFTFSCAELKDDEETQTVTGTSCSNLANLETAQYRITINSTWSSTTHPTDFPSNPHFSKIIGTSHSDSFTMWKSGATATSGFETMAETGGTDGLTTELEAAISNRTACQQFVADGPFDSPGSNSVTFVAVTQHPYVSFTTMIAPSPDWFIGGHDVLLYENGEWKSSVTLDLYAYDAGTDSGTTYASADSNTSPFEEISRVPGAPFAVTDGATDKIGTATIEKMD